MDRIPSEYKQIVEGLVQRLDAARMLRLPGQVTVTVSVNSGGLQRIEYGVTSAHNIKRNKQ